MSGALRNALGYGLLLGAFVITLSVVLLGTGVMPGLPTASPTPPSAAAPIVPTALPVTTAPGSTATPTARPTQEPFVLPSTQPVARSTPRPIVLPGEDADVIVIDGASYSVRLFSGSGRIKIDGAALIVDARRSESGELRVDWRLPTDLSTAWSRARLEVAVCGVAEGFSWQITRGRESLGPTAVPQPTATTFAPGASPEADGCWHLAAAAADTAIRLTVRAGTYVRVERLEYRQAASN